MGKKATSTDNELAAPAHFKMRVFDEWRLKSGETVRVSTDYSKFLDLVHVRRWERGKTGQLYPTEKGIAIQIGHLERLLKALKRVRAHAREIGLLPKPKRIHRARK
jgi:hypothetical protein